MTDFFDQLEQQLRQVALQPLPALGSPAPLRVRRRPRIAPRARAIAVFSALLVGAAAAAAATGLWRPLLGSHGLHPTISATRPPAAQRALLAVLRRRQTAADRSAMTRRTLVYLGLADSGVRTDYIRRLQVVDHATVVLVPVASLHRAIGSTPSPPLTHLSPTLPVSPAPSVRNALCLIYAPAAGGFGPTKYCFTTAQVRTAQGYLVAQGRVLGLVPDGVIRVTVRFANGAQASAKPHQNLFDAGSAPGGLGPRTFVWTLSDGRHESFPAMAHR